MKTIKFKHKNLNTNKLLEYGFKFVNNEYIYTKNILNNEFIIFIAVKDNVINSKIIDNFSQEEYLLVDIESSNGKFVGKIREEYEKVLNDIIKKCTVKEIYYNKQTKEVIKYLKKTYKSNLEFLWKKYPNYSVARNSNTKKWYCVIMTIEKRKLGIDSDEEVEVLNLRYNSSEIEKIIDNKTFFPGWHMSKKNWITLILDNSIDINIIYSLIDNSYFLS